jgi:UPF0271 protein
MAFAIDLHSDLGEGFGPWPMGDDEAMLAIVTSANIACGAHAGDASIMRRRCESAVERGVRIGAHVGYRDLHGFGRRHLPMDARAIEDETLHQVGALAAAATASGDRVRYVKPHGALYHDASDDPGIAEAIVVAMATLEPGLALLGPAGTELERAAVAHGLTFVAEGFADRRYRDDGRLVDRREPDAMLDGDDAVAQALRLARGEGAGPRVGSICVHGDTTGAVAMARRIRERLTDEGVALRAFT